MRHFNNFCLLGHNLLIRPEKPAETPGGIQLPDSHKMLQAMGEVLAVGSGIYIPQTNEYLHCHVQVGMHILFDPQGASGVILPNEDDEAEGFAVVHQDMVLVYGSKDFIRPFYIPQVQH